MSKDQISFRAPPKTQKRWKKLSKKHGFGGHAKPMWQFGELLMDALEGKVERVEKESPQEGDILEEIRDMLSTPSKDNPLTRHLSKVVGHVLEKSKKSQENG